MIRRCISFLLLGTMVLTVNPMAVRADGKDSVGETMTGCGTENELQDEFFYGEGLLPMQEVELEYREEAESTAIESTGSREETDWYDYAGTYYYNQMSREEKAFYDRLDAVAYSYLVGETDVNEAGEGYSPWISYEGLSKSSADDIYMVFRFENPQYYFLSGSYGWSGGGKKFAFGVYPAFAEGSKRSAATAAYKAEIEEALKTIQAVGDNPEKQVQAVHDWIIEKVSYSDVYAEYLDAMAEAVTEDEYYNLQEELGEWDKSEGYTQTAYSTFCMDETVCVGYTQAFSLLCNGLDIHSIGITSSSHAWNKVWLYGNWYQVDCTWDDPVTSSGKEYLLYNCYLRSDAYLEEADNDNGTTAHVMEEYHSTYNSPTCRYDSVGTEVNGYRYNPGVLEESAKVIEPAMAPELTAVTQNGVTTITLRCATAGTPVYYYTLDGNPPSVAGSKSIRTMESQISYTGNKTIRVLAVVDGYLESGISTYTTVLPVYQVKFDSQGGSGTESQYICEGEMATEPVSPGREGYRFGGWYREPACVNLWDFDNSGILKDTTIYASWIPIEYSLTYYLNYGSNAAANKLYYTIDMPTFQILSPVRKGYAFEGWYRDSAFTGPIGSVVKGSTGNLKLYAKWKKVSAPARVKISKLVNKKNRKLVVKYKKLSGADGYQIRYSAKSGMGGAKMVSSTSLTKTISKLKKKKTYYVQVRAYKKDSAGEKFYGKWSKKKSIRIRK